MLDTNKRIHALAAVVAAGFAASAAQAEPGTGQPQGPAITKQAWGKTSDGQPVSLYTLTSPSSMVMKVMDYGCTIVSLYAPDRNGKFADVVLGYDKLEDYIRNSPYFGCVAGRFANRIAAGKFTLDGKTYTLPTNNEPGGIPCHLHGGEKGLDKVLWRSEGILRGDTVGVQFTYLSKHGEQGYPGNLAINVTYRLLPESALRIDYEATTDQATPVNLAHHSYFNLGGHTSSTINNHELMILADHITAVDKGLIPTGELMPVKGTPFDFTQPTAIGKRVNDDHEQLKYGLGYDHNWVLNRWDGKLRTAVTLYDPKSGRHMEILTTEPGIQFYGGNFLDGSNVGKGGHAYQHRTGLCLETQHFPDSPNQPAFPSCILRPGEVYRHTAVYRFSTK
jgi:aldose 1-epimerase